jgi:hypothetical protein
MGQAAWTVSELRQALQRYERELRASSRAERTVHTYIDHPERFIRWLSGEFKVRG